MRMLICANITRTLKTYLDIGTQTCKHELRIASTPVSYHCDWFTNEHGQPVEV